MIEILTSDINEKEICWMNRSGDGSLYTLEIMFINKDIQVFRYPTKQERDRDRCRILGLPEPVWIEPQIQTDQNTESEKKSESDQPPTVSKKWQ